MKKATDIIGQVTAKSVHKHTGKNWDQWVEKLNEAGAQNMSHKDIVALLKKKYKLTLWWQQIVTGGYEVAIGRRIPGQNMKGEYSTTTTKTFPIPAKTAWKLLSSQKGLAVWLKPMSEFELKPKRSFECEGEVFGEVRTLKAGERVRMSWQETDWVKPTIVQILVLARPKNKCMIVIQHDSIKDSRTRMKLKEHWKLAIEELLILAVESQK